MSREAIAIIIGRAITEEDFRQQLIQDAAKACKGYDLTPDELQALESIEPESLETFASSLPERLIKGVGGGLIVG
jgi:hypothetical protein